MIQVFEAIRATVIAYPVLCGLVGWMCFSAVLVIRATLAAVPDPDWLDDSPSVKTVFAFDSFERRANAEWN